MKVECIRHTRDGQNLVALAGKTCYSGTSPIELEDEIECMWTKDEVRHQLDIIHDSCFEHLVFTFAIEGLSRVATHQLVRHRMASFSQQSQRYVRTKDNSVYCPSRITGSTDAEYVYYKAIDEAINAYDKLIALGIPKEDARYVLPEGILSNILVTMNGRELKHFFGLRCCSRAQEEIRELANLMLAEARRYAPHVFDFDGPQCSQIGYCPEHKSCGKMPTLIEILEANTQEE